MTSNAIPIAPFEWREMRWEELRDSEWGKEILAIARKRAAEVNKSRPDICPSRLILDSIKGNLRIEVWYDKRAKQWTTQVKDLDTDIQCGYSEADYRLEYAEAGLLQALAAFQGGKSKEDLI